MKTDFEIAREATLEPIYDIAAKAGISAVELEPYGKHIAKSSLYAYQRGKGEEMQPYLGYFNHPNQKRKR